MHQNGLKSCLLMSSIHVNAQPSVLNKENSTQHGHFLNVPVHSSSTYYLYWSIWSPGIAVLLPASSIFWEIKLPLMPVKNLSDVQLLVKQMTSRCLESRSPTPPLWPICNLYLKASHTSLICLCNVSYDPSKTHFCRFFLLFPPK